MKKNILMAIAMLFTITCLNAQEITDFGRAALKVRTATEDPSGFYDQGSERTFNICWFSYNYPSTGGDGQPVILSALACMPDFCDEEARINNVIAGCHVTITANKDCPTKFNSTGDRFNDVFFTMTLADSNDYPQEDLARHNLIILPDYEGYGITKDKAHPYLCGEITARQVTDALRYGIQLYQNDTNVESFRRPFRQDWRTICTGYSQGGAVAMATQRFIEEQGLSDELHLAGSLCGDGPYSPLVTVLYYMEQDRKGLEMSMPVVIPLMLKGLCDYDNAMSNHQISEILNERFLETGVLDWITDKDMTTDDFTEKWIQLYDEGKDGDKDYFKSVLTSNGKAMLKNILNPELYNYLNNLLDRYPDYATSNIPLPEPGTLAEDLHLALEHNNLTSGWIPSHPVFLYHSTGDEVVPFDNYLAASKQFGEQVKFYPSMINGGHVNTGMEYFLSNQRIECLRLLASMDSNGMTSITMLNATTPQWYDLFGRHIEGEPVSKGIFITRGKKILIK